MIFEYTLMYLISYFIVLFSMIHDNFNWFKKSPDWEIKAVNNLHWIKKGNPVNVEGKDYYSYLDYMFRYRAWKVITHPYDYIPAITSALVLTFVIYKRFIISIILVILIIIYSLIKNRR